MFINTSLSPTIPVCLLILCSCLCILPVYPVLYRFLFRFSRQIQELMQQVLLRQKFLHFFYTICEFLYPCFQIVHGLLKLGYLCLILIQQFVSCKCFLKCRHDPAPFGLLDLNILLAAEYGFDGCCRSLNILDLCLHFL